MPETLIRKKPFANISHHWLRITIFFIFTIDYHVAVDQARQFEIIGLKIFRNALTMIPKCFKDI